MKCDRCGEENEDCNGFVNRCSWACYIAGERERGAVDYTPNGLPALCITANSLLLECENGDHSDYKFPVTIETLAPDNDEYPEYPQTHAFIYTDGCVAVTLYEANYAMWAVRDGESLGGRYAQATDRLNEESRKKIEAHFVETTAREIALRNALIDNPDTDPAVRADAKMWLRRLESRWGKLSE